MGGGTSKHYSKIKKTGKNALFPLFSHDLNNSYSTIQQSIGSVQSVYGSDNRLVSYIKNTDIDGVTINILTLFLIVCNFLKENFAKEKNRKLQDFLYKFDKITLEDRDSLAKCSEFKKFSKFCTNKPIQQYHGYEVIRRFLTIFFSDSTGIFMKLKKEEWINYISRFLK